MNLDKNFLAILKKELIPALGCTEPIAIAYATAKARDVLGEMPERIEIICSGNIVKNVKGVAVPNAGGLKGIDVAAVLGAVGGDADSELEVLEHVTPEHIEKTKALIANGVFSCTLQEGAANLYIVARVFGNGHSASVTIVNKHTNITEISRDKEVLYCSCQQDTAKENVDYTELTVENILNFAETVNVELVKPILDHQIACNTAIAQAGLNEAYGAQVGRTLLDTYGSDIKVRARAMAAAGSDARMSGCALPVVINSGSGNQGMTVSLPVLEYAKELGVSEDKLYRALLISNFMAMHIKHGIGSLSAFCGAVSAACGSGAAITYLHGGTHEQIANTIINTLANVGGIVCDGAKASCAAKIAASIEAAIMAHHMSMNGRGFQAGDGLVLENVEDTIKSVAYMGRVGMKQTDVEILKVMLGQAQL